MRVASCGGCAEEEEGTARPHAVSVSSLASPKSAIVQHAFPTHQSAVASARASSSGAEAARGAASSAASALRRTVANSAGPHAPASMQIQVRSARTSANRRACSSAGANEGGKAERRMDVRGGGRRDPGGGTRDPGPGTRNPEPGTRARGWRPRRSETRDGCSAPSSHFPVSISFFARSGAKQLKNVTFRATLPPSLAARRPPQPTPSDVARRLAHAAPPRAPVPPATPPGSLLARPPRPRLGRLAGDEGGAGVRGEARVPRERPRPAPARRPRVELPPRRPRRRGGARRAARARSPPAPTRPAHAHAPHPTPPQAPRTARGSGARERLFSAVVNE